MNKDYILHIAYSKANYHKQKAMMSFEEKFKIIVELQKIDFEMRKSSKRPGADTKNRIAWKIKD